MLLSDKTRLLHSPKLFYWHLTTIYNFIGIVISNKIAIIYGDFAAIFQFDLFFSEKLKTRVKSL